MNNKAFGASPSRSSNPHTGARTASAPPSKLTAIIVDDDPLVRDVLRDLLTRSGEIDVLAEGGSIAQARQLVSERAPEVVFLDINLPDGRGFELLEHLGAGTSAVFVTSAEEYAVSAFDTDAVDYLLKPVSAERLRKTIQRLRQRLGHSAAAKAGTRLGLADTFLVKTMSEKQLIKVGEVKSLIAYGEYSWVYWDKAKGALLRKPLKQWEAELPEDQFVRVHRNAIINLAFMERLEKLPEGRLQVHLRNTDKPILVSLRLAPALNRKLKAFSN
jgi:two-component system LytT family response regulator